jgi:hypothetical protein
MIRFFRRLFGISTLKETPIDGLDWEWKRNTIENIMRGWGERNAFGELEWYRQFYCPHCKGELTPGPSGGGTNQVCEKCHINFGCLPGALDR